MVHTDIRAYFQGLFIRVLFIDNSVIFRDLFPSESHAKFVFRFGGGGGGGEQKIQNTEEPIESRFQINFFRLKCLS